MQTRSHHQNRTTPPTSEVQHNLGENMGEFFIKIFYFLLLLSLYSLEALRVKRPADPNPGVTLGGWVGSETWWWLKPAEYVKTDVSLDPDQDAPVTLVNGSTYILTSEVTMIWFTCQSSYPIHWEFSNSKWFLLQENTFGLYVTTGRRKSGDKDIKDARRFTYYSQLFLLGDSRMYSGEYRCQDSSPSGVGSSSLRLFWEGGPFDTVFPLARQNITVYQNPTGSGDGKVIFPCHVNNPYAQVALLYEEAYISHENNQSVDAWKAYVPQGQGVTVEFKAETGFIVGGAGSIPQTNFKCVVNDSSIAVNVSYVTPEDAYYEEEDAVYITYIPEVEHYIPQNEGSGGASLKQDVRAHKYVCCSSSGKAPTLVVHSCGEPSTCREIEAAARMQQLVHFYDSKKPSGSTLNRFYSKRFLSFLTRVEGSCTSYYYRWTSFDMDYVQCIGDGINVGKQFMTAGHGGSGSDIEKWNNPDYLKLTPNFKRGQDYPIILAKGQNDTYQVYIGSKVTFQCQGIFYFYSHGLRFSTRNEGDQDHVEHFLPDQFDDINAELTGSDALMVLRHQPPLKAEVNVTITKDLKELRCYVPQTNGTEWGVTKVYFAKKVPQSPLVQTSTGSWTPATLEHHTVMINATGKDLTCITKGDPQPHVVWTKDGKPLRFNVTNHRNNGTYILHLPKITHDLHGEYKCTSINFKGEGTKSFQVFVEETPPSSSPHVMAIIFVTIVLIGIVAVVAFLMMRFGLQRRGFNNSSNSNSSSANTSNGNNSFNSSFPPPIEHVY